MVSILLGLPISVEQAKARGISEGVCQLVVHGQSTAREAVQSFDFALAHAGGEAYVLVVGAFQAADVLVGLFQGEPIGELWGCKVYRVSTSEAVVAALSRLDAEEAAVFTGTPESAARFIEAVRSREVGWWRLSSTSVFGALTSRPDLADPVALYDPSNDSVEFLGSRDSVLTIFDALRERGFKFRD